MNAVRIAAAASILALLAGLAAVYLPHMRWYWKHYRRGRGSGYLR